MLNRNSLFAKAAFVAGAMVAGQAANAQDAGAADAEATVAADADAATAQAGADATADAQASTNIVEAAMASPDHAMLVRALQQAELVDTLSGPGPYTVFAPTDEAFGLVPQETLDALMQDSAKASLRMLLGFHVVPGSYDAETLVSRIEAAGGELSLQTIAGQPLTVKLINDAIVISDARGGQAYVTSEDMEESNGMIHVINAIVVPDFAAQQSAAPAATGTEAETDAE